MSNVMETPHRKSSPAARRFESSRTSLSLMTRVSVPGLDPDSPDTPDVAAPPEKIIPLQLHMRQHSRASSFTIPLFRQSNPPSREPSRERSLERETNASCGSIDHARPSTDTNDNRPEPTRPSRTSEEPTKQRPIMTPTLSNLNLLTSTSKNPLTRVHSLSRKPLLPPLKTQTYALPSFLPTPHLPPPPHASAPRKKRISRVFSTPLHNEEERHNSEERHAAYRARYKFLRFGKDGGEGRRKSLSKKLLPNVRVRRVRRAILWAMAASLGVVAVGGTCKSLLLPAYYRHTPLSPFVFMNLLMFRRYDSNTLENTNLNHNNHRAAHFPHLIYRSLLRSCHKYLSANKSSCTIGLECYAISLFALVEGFVDEIVAVECHVL